MAVDPQVRTLLDQMIALGGPPLEQMEVAEARRLIVAMAGLQTLHEEVARIENRRIPGPAGEIPIRIYTPARVLTTGVLVYFHGGGWVIGNIESVDGICRALANGAGCVVVSVEYRLAPEHRFPAAAEDVYAATRWIAANAASLGADPARVAVAGDSAGGNLSAVTALIARDRGGPALVQQVLIYPVTDANFETASYRDNATDYLLTKDAMLWFWNHYAPNAADRANPFAAPLRAADLSGLPPALVITAEYDPLRDEGEAYAARLRAAGVPTELTRYPGMIHGFFGMTRILDQARSAVAQVSDTLRRALGK